MWHDVLVAIGLVLVIEGIGPFLAPERLRNALLMLSRLDDATLRFAGLSSMLGGVLLLYMIR